jgi:Flp pilus assembly protein CpaB
MPFRDLLARFNGWPRKLLTLLCLLLAATSAVASRRHSSGSTAVPVVVAARPIAAGTVLAAKDVSLVQWPRSLRPPSAFRDTASVLGRRAAGAIAAGEGLTPTRLIGTGLTAGLAAGFSAVPVPLADAGSAALVRPGDFADLISSDADPGSQPTLVARQVLVIAVLPPTSEGTQAGELVVAVDQAGELRLAAVAGHGLFATVRAPP